MRIPYGTEEVAEAIVDAARRRGVAVDRLEVVANVAERRWTIRGRAQDGREHRMTFPFSSAAGISTPGEIASRYASESWPSG